MVLEKILERAKDGKKTVVIAVYVNPENKIEWKEYTQQPVELPPLVFYVATLGELKSLLDYYNPAIELLDKLEEALQKAVEEKKEFQDWIKNVVKDKIAKLLEIKKEDVERIVDLNNLKDIAYVSINEDGTINLPDVEIKKTESGECIAVDGECLPFQPLKKTKFFELLNEIEENIDHDATYKLTGYLEEGDCCTSDTEGYIAVALSGMPCEVFNEETCKFEMTIRGKTLTEIFDVIKEWIELNFDNIPTKIDFMKELNGYEVGVPYKSLQNPYAYTDEAFSVKGDEREGCIYIATVMPDTWHCGGTSHEVAEKLCWELIE